MQEFYPLDVQEAVNVAVPKMQKSIESTASSFSGDTFPTDNLQVGMLCMRTDDNNKLYKLTSINPAMWVLVDDSTARIEAHNSDVNAHSDFKGATAGTDGVRGLVPAPSNGQQDYLLHGTGWRKSPVPILARNKAYAVGDIAYSPNLPSWAYLECVTAGTTGDTEPDFTNVSTGGGTN